MIVWINGPFGIGKTHTAFELKRRLNNSFVLDPEKTGFFIQKQIPADLRLADFQNYPLWRHITRSLLEYLDTDPARTIIVPMTLVDPHYYDEVILPLREKHMVYHFTLMASKKTIETRLKKRGDRHSWNYQQLERCLSGLKNHRFQVYIDTDTLNLYQVVEYIANQIGRTLSPDNRSKVIKFFHKIKTLVQHIR